ncbi:dihydrofolate reductase family protein [Nocardioides sp. C4-1]|uniref:dihydrofolate reductase family protein n=1 Tax=Nocardioides sp. C4-1 TaxID=3151851 RepID=UPI003262D36D
MTSHSVLHMSMSLDGYVAVPDDGPGMGLGVDGGVLHDWLGPSTAERPWFDPPGVSGQVFAELMTTGAVVVGRKTFEYAGQWDGDHHGVPIFVATRDAAVHDVRPPYVHVVDDDLATLKAWAKEAAGDADVLVHGADLARACLEAGVLDDLELAVVPVLLGGGRRLVDALGTRVALEQTRVLVAPAVTHLRYRVVR